MHFKLWLLSIKGRSDMNYAISWYVCSSLWIVDKLQYSRQVFMLRLMRSQSGIQNPDKKHTYEEFELPENKADTREAGDGVQSFKHF